MKTITAKDQHHQKLWFFLRMYSMFFAQQTFNRYSSLLSILIFIIYTKLNTQGFSQKLSHLPIRWKKMYGTFCLFKWWKKRSNNLSIFRVIFPIQMKNLLVSKELTPSSFKARKPTFNCMFQSPFLFSSS